MDPQKIEKKIKDAKGVAIVILVLQIIMIVFTLIGGQMSTTIIIAKGIGIALLIATISGYSQRKMSGPICGIIVSILIIISFNILDMLIGILYLIDNINLIKYIQD